MANGPLWQAMSILAAISGFSVLTLGITYLRSLGQAGLMQASGRN